MNRMGQLRQALKQAVQDENHYLNEQIAPLASHLEVHLHRYFEADEKHVFFPKAGKNGVDPQTPHLKNHLLYDLQPDGFVWFELQVVLEEGTLHDTIKVAIGLKIDSAYQWHVKTNPELEFPIYKRHDLDMHEFAERIYDLVLEQVQGRFRQKIKAAL
ncbi:hypothetical protein [Deinococcus roseus]|uniref:Histidine kinase n=1 Tax=Deinococcus roseus TaxID=392414 RepID=A0ABQ2D9N6_9DEIO|nr:hypothetical protein [Deinococcus roseus]GGJ50929.1 hypothetical protein GCM10008938_41140 [Deinococcus roseus]